MLLLRQVLSTLLLFIKIIPLSLHKFSSFLLVSLILSSKTWSLRWIILDNSIFLCYRQLIEEITFLMFWRIFRLLWISFVPLWITIKLGFFSYSRSDIINEVICCCSHFHWIITKNFSPIDILEYRIAYNKNFFLYRWAICRLSFNQVTIIVAFIYCCFIVLFRRGGLFIGLWLLEWLSVTSVFIPFRTLDWVLLIFYFQRLNFLF